MHRDIKPHNFVFDSEKKDLKLIDFGLAEHYSPNKSFSTRVASLYFKAPELLLGYSFYDYSVDIWALGATFASIVIFPLKFKVYKRSPFFHGANPEDQMDKISCVLGTSELFEYMKFYEIELEPRFNVKNSK